ncbi:hypothetical protein [Daejeonella oryzae]|uniref:hypothetical protein n=1 Tax=Daejeonella oryzae TaxID=1122943 RepID=UPI00042874F8|nr:hypothetical protein [Daejeonella oryzae]
MIRLIILAAILLIIPTWSVACTCSSFGQPLTIKEYNENQFIIAGKAKKVTIVQNETTYKQLQIDFEIEELYKGNLVGRTIKIYTSLGDASCGLNVKENEEWIIWEYLQNNAVSTNLCTRSIRKNHVSSIDLKSLKYFKSNPSSTEWKNESGIKIASGKLEANKPVGHWKYFYPDGSSRSEGFYINGKQHGKWITYLDPKGIVTRLKYDKLIAGDLIPD